MNIPNILLLADRLERDNRPTIDGKPMAFDMNTYFTAHGCGSAGCIAGWAMALAFPNESSWSRAFAYGGDFLGLTGQQAGALFEPDPEKVTYDNVTPTQAARVLRHLAATGTVDWSQADVD